MSPENSELIARETNPVRLRWWLNHSGVASELNDLLNAARRETLRDALTMTGCMDAENLQDMANVGNSLMDAIDSVVTHGPLKGWTPADDPAEIVTDLVNLLDKARRALFMCAAHCQGGHSAAGSEASQVLGVPFPITMSEMVAKARADGLNPAELWPWAPTGLFTAKERAEARARK
jgi:hypothetical protein